MLFSNSIKEKLLSETKLSASRSSGPGGQNINKISTKVELRFSVVYSKFLSDKQKHLILLKLKNRITTTGDLVLTEQSERTQRQNRQKVIKKFFTLLEKSLATPKKRIKTHPSRASIQKRLKKKKIEAQKKQLRKPPDLHNT